MPAEAAPPKYALGHSPRELDRLGTQAELVNPITRRYLLEAGLTPGMRVLDVGSGAGDVALLLAELVGPEGEVVGSDRSEAALATARRRVEERSLANVAFRVGDAAELAFDGEFDAVVGRYVLQYQPDPPTFLRRVAAHARSGAPIVFHEPFRDAMRSYPPVPSYDGANELVSETVRRLGGDASMGLKLHATFVAAGLPPPTLRLEAVIGSGRTSPEHVRYEMDLLPTLLPEMHELGIAPAGVDDADAWVERVLADVAAADAVVVSRTEVGAWSRRP